MARYRHKDETDMAWNRIRRKVTRALDTEIQNRREEVLNDLLAGAWEEFSLSLKQGTVVELEDKYEKLIGEIVQDAVKPKELADALVAKR